MPACSDGQFEAEFEAERGTRVVYGTALEKREWLSHSTPPNTISVYLVGCVNSVSYLVIPSGDIGCYTIGLLPPYNMLDYIISMGASAGMAHGIKKVSKQKVVVFMGDSTFFHAGMAGIANIVYNKTNPLIVIMDNGITAMTGHQPHPGTGFNATWEKTKPIIIENVVRGIGIKHVAIVNPMDKKSMVAKVREFANITKTQKEPAVIISRAMCILHRKHLKRKGLLQE